MSADGYGSDTVRNVVVASGNATLLEVSLKPTRTDVTRRDEEAVFGFALSQNYPNPFNPTTTLSFAVGHLSFVNLTLYDVLGQEVATLVNEQKQPGIYKAVWDAANMPSGFYICRMSVTPTASGQVQNLMATRKLILMK